MVKKIIFNIGDVCYYNGRRHQVIGFSCNEMGLKYTIKDCEFFGEGSKVVDDFDPNLWTESKWQEHKRFESLEEIQMMGRAIQRDKSDNNAKLHLRSMLAEHKMRYGEDLRPYFYEEAFDESFKDYIKKDLNSVYGLSAMNKPIRYILLNSMYGINQPYYIFGRGGRNMNLDSKFREVHIQPDIIEKLNAKSYADLHFSDLRDEMMDKLYEEERAKWLKEHGLKQMYKSVYKDQQDLYKMIFGGDEKSMGTKKKMSITINEAERVVTVVFPNGKKAMSRCSKDDKFDPYVGVALCIAAEQFGSKTKFKKYVDEHGKNVKAKKEK